MHATLNILSLAVALFAAHALMRGLLPAPLADLPVAIRGILALVTLGLGIRGYSACRVKPRSHEANARRKPGLIDHAAAAGALLALHFAFLWLLGAAPSVIERIGIAAEPWLRPEHAAKRIDLETTADADRSGNWLWQDRRSRSLPPRTNLRPGNRPEVFLRFTTADDAAAVVGNSAYLGSFALSKYAGGRWTTDTTPPARIDIADDGFARFPAPPARASFGLIRHEVFHGINPTGQNVLTALQGVESVEIAPLETYDDGFVMLPDPLEDRIGFQYRAASRPLVLANLQQDAPVETTADIPAALLDLPESTRLRTHLHEQARAIVGENPTVRSLAALEAWMRDAFDYSLQTTNPQNLDPLENFLFSERRGHCEHFAMTTALMLRTLELPSRVAYGWAGGTWYESSQLMVFRSREAHAWTEVWLPEFGWVVMDPTPPSGIDGTRSRVAPADEKPPNPTEEFTEDGEIPDTTRIDLAAAWLLGIFGLPALTLLMLRYRTQGGFVAGTPPGIPGGGPASGYLAAWRAACPPLHPGETLRKQIHRHDAPPAFADRLIHYHYRIQYNHYPRDPATERELERAIRKWRKERETRHSME